MGARIPQGEKASLSVGYQSTGCGRKEYPRKIFSQYFLKGLKFFQSNFTRLLHVHIYAKLQHFTKLSLTLTKLCHTKRDHFLNVFLHYTRKKRKVRSLEQSFGWKTLIFEDVRFLTQSSIDGRKLPCRNHLDSFSRFDRTPTCDRQTDTDGHRQTQP